MQNNFPIEWWKNGSLKRCLSQLCTIYNNDIEKHIESIGNTIQIENGTM